MRGSPAPVIWPKLLELKAAIPLLAEGSFKFTRLKTLKYSARNWSFQRSVTVKFFISPMSHVQYFGPRSVPLPVLPNVPAAGCWNAAGLIQVTQCGEVPQLLPTYGSPPTNTARSVPFPTPDLSLPELSPDVTVRGRPVWNCVEPLSIHPPAISRSAAFQSDIWGSCKTYEPTTR